MEKSGDRSNKCNQCALRLNLRRGAVATDILRPAETAPVATDFLKDYHGYDDHDYDDHDDYNDHD